GPARALRRHGDGAIRRPRDSAASRDRQHLFSAAALGGGAARSAARRPPARPGRCRPRARRRQATAADFSGSAALRGAHLADLAKPRSPDANDALRDRPSAAAPGSLPGGVRAIAAAAPRTAAAAASDRSPPRPRRATARGPGGGRKAPLPARAARRGRRREGGGARRTARRRGG